VPHTSATATCRSGPTVSARRPSSRSSSSPSNELAPPARQRAHVRRRRAVAQRQHDPLKVRSSSSARTSASASAITGASKIARPRGIGLVAAGRRRPQKTLEWLREARHRCARLLDALVLVCSPSSVRACHYLVATLPDAPDWVQLCGALRIFTRERGWIEDSLLGRQGRIAFAYLTLHRLRAVPRTDRSTRCGPRGCQLRAGTPSVR
jgi:hypothetical protein